MKNGEIFKKTMPFVWGRFGMQLALNLGLIVYFAIIVWLFTALIESQAVIAVVVGFIALGIGIKLYSFGCEYISYMIKAAHVAVIGELALYGKLPDGVDMKTYGKNKVKERFLTANVFFAIDKLMSAAVRQIQNGISKIGGMFEKIQIVQTIISIINVFVGIVLGYVDEAVLARVFQKKEEGAWKASCDGVVLYFQNWKAILKNALGITLGIVAFYAIGMGALYGLLALISGGAGDGWAILFLIIAFFVIDVIKVAFVDSYVTISVVNKYLPLTMNQQPALDIYEKGQKWSKKFKDMCNKAKEEPQPVVQAAVAGVPGMTMAMPTGQVPQPAQPQVVMQQPGMPVQQPMMQQQPMAQPMMQQPVMQQPVAQQPMMQQPMAPQQPMMQPKQMMPQQPVQQPVAQPVMQPQQPMMQQPQMGQPMAQPQQMMNQPVMGAQPVGQPMPGQFPNNNGQM
jgi:hypothetical protein